MRYAIVIRYEFDRAWLQLDRATRAAHRERFEREIVAPFAGRLSVRHFDAEAFATGYSDVLLIETEDLDTYYFFVEKLRDSDLIARGWVRLHDITIGIEDGYRAYEQEMT